MITLVFVGPRRSACKAKNRSVINDAMFYWGDRSLPYQFGFVSPHIICKYVSVEQIVKSKRAWVKELTRYRQTVFGERPKFITTLRDG